MFACLIHACLFRKKNGADDNNFIFSIVCLSCFNGDLRKTTSWRTFFDNICKHDSGSSSQIYMSVLSFYIYHVIFIHHVKMHILHNKCIYVKYISVS